MMIKFQSGQCDCTPCCLKEINNQKEASLKSASSSIELREVNGVQYYALKSNKEVKVKSTKQEKPYWITLMQRFE